MGQILRFAQDDTGDDTGGVDNSTAVDIATLIARHILLQPEPPRWILLAGFSQLMLIDRQKWNEKRALRFDLEDILGRRETATLQAMAALLHREHTCPADGLALLDTLDENSHKHAFAVSEDLKYALREAIELIGNEAVWYLREVRKKGVFSGEEKLDADQLTRECLRYMYRLLFLFYIEARPELGYAPMNADVYLKGYSLESLRRLEMVRLTTDEARNGYYLDSSVRQLFGLVYEGYDPGAQQDAFGRGSFAMPPLKSHLFDPEQTPTLEKVKLRNFVLQQVIHAMSLSNPKRAGRKKARRGRISYAQLGINQLGAVYEALLSYRGFFAEHDLYEVKPAKEKYDELKQAYFVRKEDLEKYDRKKEWVYDEKGEVRKHEKGRFIYRLAGRDRQNSASYYTPEVLTQCLVKYALKELIGDDETGTPADDILRLTICEPAMGSAAFLNEAVNQLADAYLRRKQKERGETLTPDDYAAHKQKVKMFLADNNVFGVDLNPVAVELAEVSLWLNTIHKGGFVPWFGLQLVCGNSLVGARRQLYNASLLSKKAKGKGQKLWYEEAPVEVGGGASASLRSFADAQDDHSALDTRHSALAEGHSTLDTRHSALPQGIYHFLLPDPGMAAYNDKVIRKLAPDEINHMKAWRKDFVKPFTPGEIQTLQRLTAAIDRLWDAHAQQMHDIRVRTTDELVIYGGQGFKTDRVMSTREKDAILNRELYSEEMKNASPYRRLKLVMDYWCALWFWPIEQADLLPTRSQYLQDVLLILEGEAYVEQVAEPELFPATMPRHVAETLRDAMGFVDLDALIADTPRLQTVQNLYNRYRFLHWELEFADLFAYKGGFDLVLGNPPWIKVEWNEGSVLGDAEPRFDIQKVSAAQKAKLRDEVLEAHDMKGEFLSTFEGADGMQNYLNAYSNYPLLKGQQTNLYKCFITNGWEWISKAGITALITQDGVYNDANGGVLRKACYERLIQLFSFHNEKVLFDIGHTRRFDLHIFGCEKEVEFHSICNLFQPNTIDDCFNPANPESFEGIKDDSNQWNLFGRSDRIVTVNSTSLSLFAELYDAPGTPSMEARIPSVHSMAIFKVLRKFALLDKKLASISNEYTAIEMWHETNAQKDETIFSNNHFPSDELNWILSGPHFYVANPFYKCPEVEYTNHHSYQLLDLTQIPAGYLPRTLYTPACSPEEYRRRTPGVPWDKAKKVTDYYRLIHRRMLSQSGERTLVCSIIPKEIGHLHTCISTSFENNHTLLETAAIMQSLPFDFYVKTTGRGDFTTGYMGNIPLLFHSTAFEKIVYVRTLLLNCLTTHYEDLWRDCWDSAFTKDRWTKDDPRLSNNHFAALTSEWTWDTLLRTDYARRQALVELDVLAAKALGLTLEELQTIYRVQFPVLRWNDRNTFYDQQGRIVYTVSKGLPGVGFKTKEWREIKDMQSGTVERVITDDTQPGGPVERTIVYEAPFDGVDREADYATAWAAFGEREG